MKFRKTVFVLTLLLASLCVGVAATPSASAKSHTGSDTYTFSIGGVHADRMCAFRSFNGEYTLQNFAVINNQLVAEGRVSGTITGPSGCNVTPVTVTNQTQTLPVSSISATCTRLDVQFGVTGLQPDNFITLEGATFTISSQQAKHKFCGVANAVKNHAAPHRLAHKLNKALDLK